MGITQAADHPYKKIRRPFFLIGITDALSLVLTDLRGYPLFAFSRCCAGNRPFCLGLFKAGRRMVSVGEFFALPHRRILTEDAGLDLYTGTA